ncbi:MAG TPA: cupin-like domain-containing protein [Steroidobacteraceae bacterium]|nr:cupin-like domain-containing protein [Steroidobacteraceae bacterium]
MSAPNPSLEIDAQIFRSHFNRRPFLFCHRLSGHPLFELEPLAGLSQALHGRWIEYNDGQLPVSVPRQEDIAYTGLTIGDSIRKASEVCSWVVLKRTERFPEYASVMDACLDEIAPLAEALEPGMCEREAAIFVSSPGAVTPYHMDHEINFLLQLRGTKTVSVFNADDREVLSELELESYFSGPAIHRNMHFEERYQQRAAVFELREGLGVHIPSTAPHWVRNGAGTSVSLSVAFKSDASLQRGDVYRMNALLRRLGLRPADWNASRSRDRVKRDAYRALRRVQGLLGA